MLNALRTALILPFRLVAGAFDLLGRLASLVLGFVLMVGGVALMAGSLLIVGVPVFVFGLLLTLRALG